MLPETSVFFRTEDEKIQRVYDSAEEMTGTRKGFRFSRSVQTKRDLACGVCSLPETKRRISPEHTKKQLRAVFRIWYTELVILYK